MATTYQSLMDRLREQNKHIIAAQQPQAPASAAPVNPAPQPTTSAPDWLGRPQNTRLAEQENELSAMRNDYSNLFEGDQAVIDRINGTFTGIGNRLYQGGQLANQIGQEYLAGIDKDLQDYMSIFGEGGVARGDLDNMLGSQQAALDAERARMDTIYNLENEGIAANAAASGATGGAVAAERARLRGEEAARRAEYATKVAELAATKKNALLDMYNKVSQYKDLYRANYANSRDKYALDAYNQITEAQTNLLSQIKNFELQEKQMAANAASASQLAGAIGGKATPVGNNIPTGAGAVDPIPEGYYDGLTPGGGQTPNGSGIVGGTIAPANNDVGIPIAPQSLQSDGSYIPYAAGPESGMQYGQTDTPDASYQKGLRQQEEEVRNTIRNTSVRISNSTKTVADINKELQDNVARYGSNYQNTPYGSLRYNQLISERQRALQTIDEMKKKQAEAVERARVLGIQV